MSRPSGLLVIRHAETNMAGSFCGHSNPPLNAKGYQQLENLLEQLEDERIDSVYTSDLKRAETTARAIAKYSSSPLTQCRDLREINFGTWEGLSWKDAELKDPAYAKRWVDSFPRLSAPDGEQYEAFEKRILTEVRKLSQIAINQRIAVITHAGAMQVILMRLCGVDDYTSWKLTRSYCSSFTYPMVQSLRENVGPR